MRFLLALSLVVLGLSQASAHIPPRVPDPVRLEAARRLVAALPVAEAIRPQQPGGGEAMRAQFAYRMAHVARQAQGIPDLERIMPAFQAEIHARVDAALPGLLAAALDDIATAYAFEMEAADLDAAARFFASPQGRGFAARIVVTDRIVFEMLHGRLAGAIEPELTAILASARARDAEQRRAYAEWDRLRRRVNAESRRRNRR